MEKVKIKLNAGQSQVIASEILIQIGMMEIDSYPKQVVYAALEEVYNIVLDLNRKCIGKKPKSKNIPVSNALVFFSLAIAWNFSDAYTRISFKTMCKQIEEQLFQRGEFRLPQKGVEVYG